MDALALGVAGAASAILTGGGGASRVSVRALAPTVESNRTVAAMSGLTRLSG
jgi:hypothetical protein